jgi:hypothetical protein
VVPRRGLLIVLGVLSVLGVSMAPVAAAEPIDARDPVPAVRRHPASDRTVVLPPIPTAPPQPAPAPQPRPDRQPARPDGPIGLDVSWPQCNDELPDGAAYAIVGVNRGRVYSANPCLEAQLEWAGEGADVYMNTANPGPQHSSFWPSGAREPRDCDTRDQPGDHTRDCAYVYGWNSAAHSYGLVRDAYAELGWLEANKDEDRLPEGITWWLDVETANSWQRDRALNVAALHGSVDYLESMGASVGFYSTPLLWWRVTFGSDDFADYPSWHAGAHSRREAMNRCERDEGFTDGPLVMVQWVQGGLDRNYRCG